MSVEEKLLSLKSYSEELGLDLTRPEDRFKWFLASILFAKRISAEIAKRTFRLFEAENLTSPEKIIEAGWDRLVEILDSGGYVRYDFSTASNLLAIMKKLKGEYGDLERLHQESSDPSDLEKRLMEFRGIWSKAKPKPSKMAVEAARKIGLKNIEPYESALVRLSLEYCKKRRCRVCPVREYCNA